MPEWSEKSHGVTSLRSLSNAQYDAWGMRSALISRGLPTTSFPGDVVTTDDEGSGSLAFAQLGSNGVTFGGMGLTKASKKTWSALAFAGLPVPNSKMVSTGDDSSALRFSQALGFPVAVTSQAGAYRRVARNPEQLSQALAEVRRRAVGPVLIAESIPGDIIRLLVRGDKVLATAGQLRDRRIDLAGIDPSIRDLAVNAVEAIPGVDLAGVTIVSPQLAPVNARKEAMVERVSHYPHLREYAGGTRHGALRIAGALVTASAREVGVQLAKPAERLDAHFDFSGIPRVDTFFDGLQQSVASFSDVKMISDPLVYSDRVQMRLRVSPQNAALIITRALIGFTGADSSHMVICRPES